MTRLTSARNQSGAQQPRLWRKRSADLRRADGPGSSLEQLESRQLLAVTSLRPMDITDLAGSDQSLSISDDGRYVVFSCSNTNVIAGQIDRNGPTSYDYRSDDVFLYDRTQRTTKLVSRRFGTTTTTGNGLSYDAQISGNGQYIVFRSMATDLLEGIQESGSLSEDVFRYSVATGAIDLVSHGATSQFQAGDAHSFSASISAGGDKIAFVSVAGNLPKVPGDPLGYYRYRGYIWSAGGTLEAVAVGGSQYTVGIGQATYGRAQISRDGSTAVFTLRNERLAIHRNGVTQVVFSMAQDGTPVAVSRTGDIIAFLGTIDHLGYGGHENSPRPLFVFQNGEVSLVSRAAGTNGSLNPFDPATRYVVGSFSLSPDGSYLAFASEATDLTSNQVDLGGKEGASSDIFLYQTSDRFVELVSHMAGQADVAANARSLNPKLSGQSRFVTYLSDSDQLTAYTDRNTLARDKADLFRYDRTSGITTLVSSAIGQPGTTETSSCSAFIVSPSEERPLTVFGSRVFGLFGSSSYLSTYTLRVSAPAKTIIVLGRDHSIASGDLTPSLPDGTRFARTLVSRTTKRTFVVTNTGELSLLIGGQMRLSGPGRSQFRILTQPRLGTVIGPGQSVQVTVQFRPTTAGLKRARLQLVSDADDHPLYAWSIDGTAFVR